MTIDHFLPPLLDFVCLKGFTQAMSIQKMQFTNLLTKTITFSKFMLNFCDKSNLETIKAKLFYCHPVQKLGL